MQGAEGEFAQRADAASGSGQGFDTQAADLEIRARAYEIYLSRGGGEGDPVADWLTAEQQVRARRQQENNPAPGF